MASGKSGYVEFSSSVSWGTVRVYWSETYDAATNKSTVTIESIRVKSTNWYGVTYYPDGVLKVNGVKVASFYSNLGTTLVRVGAQGNWYSIVDSTDTSKVITASLNNIAHNDDGSKTVSIELTGNRFNNFCFFTTSDEYGSGWSVNDSKSITLTTIPRASTIGASAANIGEASTITVTRKATAYTHSIKYKFGDLSGYINADGSASTSEVKISATSISFTVPTSFYAEIPDATSGTCTLTCTTYSGSTKIGNSQTTTFKATASKSACAPTVSGTVVDSNEATIRLTGNKNKLIRYMSNALCTITAKAKNSATIETKKIGGTAVTGNTRTINSIEASSVSFVATDSRGYSTTKRVTLSLVEYIKLTVNVQLQRTDPTSGNAILTIWGDYFNGSFGAVENNLTIRFRLKKSSGSYGNYQDVTAVLDGNSYSAEIALSGLDYESAYTVSVTATDSIMNGSKEATVSQGIPVFDWGENDFRFNLALLFTTNSYGNTLPTENLKKGQIFFLKNSGDGFTIRIYNGTTWL